MSVSTGTPGGSPILCRVCGAVECVEPANPLGDAVCPRCGSLVVWVKDALADYGLLPPDKLSLHTDLGETFDSMDVTEFIMAAEEQLGVRLPDTELERVRTVEDFVRLVRRVRRLRGEYG